MGTSVKSIELYFRLDIVKFVLKSKKDKTKGFRRQLAIFTIDIPTKKINYTRLDIPPTLFFLIYSKFFRVCDERKKRF